MKRCGPVKSTVRSFCAHAHVAAPKPLVIQRLRIRSAVSTTATRCINTIALETSRSELITTILPSKYQNHSNKDRAGEYHYHSTMGFPTAGSFVASVVSVILSLLLGDDDGV